MHLCSLGRTECALICCVKGVVQEQNMHIYRKEGGGPGSDD